MGKNSAAQNSNQSPLLTPTKTAPSSPQSMMMNPTYNAQQEAASRRRRSNNWRNTLMLVLALLTSRNSQTDALMSSSLTVSPFIIKKSSTTSIAKSSHRHHPTTSTSLHLRIDGGSTDADADANVDGTENFSNNNTPPSSQPQKKALTAADIIAKARERTNANKEEANSKKQKLFDDAMLADMADVLNMLEQRVKEGTGSLDAKQLETFEAATGRILANVKQGPP
mmetsp:Transcript_7244/g.10662  ORF Transcript_7244/g.10662 Transcript_7244/m.10662 type:complete len:225 (+) Transcript_7244:1-675(+)